MSYGVGKATEKCLVFPRFQVRYIRRLAANVLMFPPTTFRKSSCSLQTKVFGDLLSSTYT